MLYFAYGSNMDPSEIAYKAPQYKFVTVARVPDHRLGFHFRSKKRQCGVPDLIEATGESVWGVLYDVPDLQVEDLDRAEGRGTAYDRVQVRVVTEEGQEREAETYVVHPPLRTRYVIPPSRAYVDHMLAGCEAWEMPVEWVAQVEAIPIST